MSLSIMHHVWAQWKRWTSVIPSHTPSNWFKTSSSASFHLRKKNILFGEGSVRICVIMAPEIGQYTGLSATVSSICRLQIDTLCNSGRRFDVNNTWTSFQTDCYPQFEQSLHNRNWVRFHEMGSLPWWRCVHQVCVCQIVNPVPCVFIFSAQKKNPFLSKLACFIVL